MAPVVGFFIAGDVSLIVVRRSLLALSFLLVTFAIALLAHRWLRHDGRRRARVVSLAHRRRGAAAPRLPGRLVALSPRACAGRPGRISPRSRRGSPRMPERSSSSIGGARGRHCDRVTAVSAPRARMHPVISASSAMLKGGELGRDEPLAPVADWPNAGPTIVAAWLEMSADPGRQVPTYPIGLPLLMAAVRMARRRRGCVRWSPPLVARSSRSGRRRCSRDRIGGPAAAIVAAVWLATSPVALIEAMQPMSDVPATAAWLVCWAAIVTCLARRQAARQAVGPSAPASPRAWPH